MYEFHILKTSISEINKDSDILQKDRWQLCGEVSMIFDTIDKYYIVYVPFKRWIV